MLMFTFFAMIFFHMHITLHKLIFFFNTNTYLRLSTVLLSMLLLRCAIYFYYAMMHL